MSRPLYGRKIAWPRIDEVQAQDYFVPTWHEPIDGREAEAMLARDEQYRRNQARSSFTPSTRRVGPPLDAGERRVVRIGCLAFLVYLCFVAAVFGFVVWGVIELLDILRTAAES